MGGSTSGAHPESRTIFRSLELTIWKALVFADGSWKDKEFFSGQCWYSTLEGFDGLMGARNVRASLSPLHSEVEALLWAMECMRNLR